MSMKVTNTRNDCHEDRCNIIQSVVNFVVNFGIFPGVDRNSKRRFSDGHPLQFLDLPNKDTQNLHLQCLIENNDIKTRRPRKAKQCTTRLSYFLWMATAERRYVVLYL
ncbi:hypothetical protein PR048_011477 [Dryococelus australis]|uniref:Uncharacterized protein n=1 Tax=Dryococelus australis TaxID=614101 RepID=A0ABQ9HM65_9NEOP|nr:hypothetical protein PR048_011477 [Dryococelus australis]